MTLPKDRAEEAGGVEVVLVTPKADMYAEHRMEVLFGEVNRMEVLL